MFEKRVESENFNNTTEYRVRVLTKIIITGCPDKWNSSPQENFNYMPMPWICSEHFFLPLLGSGPSNLPHWKLESPIKQDLWTENSKPYRNSECKRKELSTHTSHIWDSAFLVILSMCFSSREEKKRLKNDSELTRHAMQPNCKACLISIRSFIHLTVNKTIPPFGLY